MSVSPPTPVRVAAPLPDRGGVGLKADHVEQVLAERPDLGFFEVHAENYMGDGGPAHRRLEAIRALYPSPCTASASRSARPSPSTRTI